MISFSNDKLALFNGDCLEDMKQLPDKCIDLILTDPPYGTTVCKWDTVIDLDMMWVQLKRVIKDNGAIVLFGSQPFSSILVTSNLGMFKYELVWDKVNRYTGALNSNRMPMKRHEQVLVFYKKLPVYNKQLRKGEPYISKQTKGHGEFTNGEKESHTTVNIGGRNPCSILQFKADLKKEMGLHPTQKPVALMEYLIKTYTNKGNTVLDFTMGSGTTGVACMNLNRSFVGIELDSKYFEIAKNRIIDKSI